MLMLPLPMTAIIETAVLDVFYQVTLLQEVQVNA